MLKAIKDTGKIKNGKHIWLCECDCGNTCEISSSAFNRNNSCGCMVRKSRITHHKSNTRLFDIWRGMKKRCYNPNSPAYQWYGEKGIKLCKDWEDNFENFYNWAVNNGYRENLTIERTDIDKDYEPSNCKWITNEEQANNRRTCNFITYQGETLNMSQWSKKLGISYNKIQKRYHDGLPPEKILEVTK